MHKRQTHPPVHATAAATVGAIALLGQLDAWMAAAGHAPDHPWRASIGEALATEAERAPAAGSMRVVTGDRYALAVEALDEINCAAGVLQREWARSGAREAIASRGILKRMETLTDAALECLGYADDWSDAQLRDIILCEENGHG